MARFNTLPTKVTAETDITVTGQLIPPTLVRDNYDVAARFKFTQKSNRFEGFLGDGDYIELPISAPNSVVYFNNADVIQFSIARTTIAGTSEDWVGFTFDKTDGLIYVVVVSEDENPNLYFLASINQAGTIVNIGQAQPGVDFAGTTGSWYNTGATTATASNIQRAADGSGNMFVRQTQTIVGMQEMEINITDGSIVSDPAVIDPNLLDISWRSKAGNYWSIDTADVPRLFAPVTGAVRVVTSGSVNFGWVINSPSHLLQWKGRVVETDATIDAILNMRLSTDIKKVDAWVDLIIDTYGMG